ncbi:MAG: alpha-L-rhamnosidase N-terminal domain-containing protein, partial [Bacteroidaceae bacterium]|nr:alpha-L-rhamnosidase N-terminal domain-containing protein [Bacteroidaceae bacterium]
MKKTSLSRYAIRGAFCALLLTLTPSCRTTLSSLQVTEQRCEHLLNPTAIGGTVPLLSWQLRAGRDAAAVTAYQVLVATSPDKLTPSRADLWNSGKVAADEWGTRCGYGGTILHARSQAYWTVRVWDERDKASAWSPAASFGVGLLHAEDWTARFIGMKPVEGKDECPVFRRTFQVEKVGAKTLLHVNSLGYHEAYLNGSPVTDAVLQPAVSELSKRSLINTYDVTPLMRTGINDLVIHAGKGWYQPGLPGVVAGGPYVRAQLEALQGDTWQVLAATDSTWQATSSGRTAFGDWRPLRFGGERVDGSSVPRDYSAASLDERPWQAVTLPVIPPHQSTPQMVEPNRVTIHRHPTNVWAEGDSVAEGKFK